MLHKIGVLGTMKSKIKIFIIGVIIICLAGIYAVIDKSVSVYDTECDTSAFQSVTLEQGKNIEQTFLCMEEFMDGISLKIAADGMEDKGQAILDYEMLDASTGESLTHGEIALKRLSSGKFFKIKFDRITDSKEKEYTFRLAVKECPTGSVRVFYTPGKNVDASFVYDGQTVDGVEVMRTLTHRFDLETFVVTLCFVAYVILFMRWLCKLFE